MTIYRGPGGTGSASSEVDTTEFQEFLVQAQAAKVAAEAARDAALVSENNAELAEANAETAETNAEAAATTATSAASSASTSATNAASSATAAATSASEAAADAASINPANLVHISGTETITGAKTFSQTITGSITGNAANVTGTIAVANGGTGATTASGARTNLGLVIGTDVQAYSANTSTYASTGVGFRNRIINGDMRIDQRNAGASVTPTSDGQYTLDRWASRLTAASKFSVQQNAGSVTPPAGYTNYIGVTSLSAYSLGASDFFGLQQSIEGFNTADFAWGTASGSPATLSFWVRSSLTGNFGCVLYNASGSVSIPLTYTISTANTWQYITVAIPTSALSGTLSSTTNGLGISLFFSLGAGTSQSGGTPGTWSGTLTRAPTGSTSVVGTNGATFYITGVQLEAGTVATPFERRDYGRELMMCQRYYFKTYNTDTAPGTPATGLMTSIQAACNYATIGISFPVQMRASPTCTVFNPNTGASGSVVTDSITKAAGAAGITAGGASIRISNVLSTVDQFMFGHLVASIEL